MARSRSGCPLQKLQPCGGAGPFHDYPSVLRAAQEDQAYEYFEIVTDTNWNARSM